MLSPDQNQQILRHLQALKLNRLISAILPQNKFYARKFREAGLDLDSIKGLEDLSRIPFTTKQELQEDQAVQPPYGSRHGHTLEKYIRIHQTSGTTGQSIFWLDTRESWKELLNIWGVIYDAAGVTETDRFFFPFSFGPFIGFWAAFDGAIKRGNLCIPGGGLSSVARLQWILKHEVTVITCTPTYALRLGEVARQENIDLASSSVRVLIVAGEPGGNIPEIRSKIEQAWGATCLDHWGMTEVGPVGFEPIENPGAIHMVETHCIVEVVDPESGSSLTQAGQGELVITTLERQGSPLLRYRTGDLVEYTPPEISADGLVPPSPGVDGVDEDNHEEIAELSARLQVSPLTGEPFLRLNGGILGRLDQMVLIRGNNVYPGAIDAIVRHFSEIEEYQAELFETQTGLDLQLRVEFRSSIEEKTQVSLKDKLIRAFQDRLFFRPAVIIAPAQSLPRFELKARRFTVFKEKIDHNEHNN